MKKTIGIIEDDVETQRLITIALVQNEYNVLAFESGEEALRQLNYFQIDLILLDVHLGQMSGFEVCEQIRRVSNVPILFLSFLDDSPDIVRGLELGGDDYITKPFDLVELLARIKSNLRRSPTGIRDADHMAAASQEGQLPSKLLEQIGNTIIDYQVQKVQINGVPIALSQKEFQILVLFIHNIGIVFSANELFQTIWGEESLSETRTIKVHISHLRKKLEAHPYFEGTIRSIRGFGYQFQLS